MEQLNRSTSIILHLVGYTSNNICFYLSNIIFYIQFKIYSKFQSDIIGTINL